MAEPAKIHTWHGHDRFNIFNPLGGFDQGNDHNAFIFGLHAGDHILALIVIMRIPEANAAPAYREKCDSVAAQGYAGMKLS